MLFIFTSPVVKSHTITTSKKIIKFVFVQHVGCDYVLGSNATFDSCGVCNGRNLSCSVITGRFTQVVNESGEFDYAQKLPSLLLVISFCRICVKNIIYSFQQ